jgi:two-component system, response regulator YesN
MRLLVVDDEPVIRKGLVRMAEQYEPSFTKIQTAENGAVALERIRAAEPDIVLTDIRMPKLDGLELCRLIHAEYPHIKVVVISGYNDFEYAQKSIVYGVRQYLLKPVVKSELHELLNQLIKVPSYNSIPPSRYVEWMDRMESCIWNLQWEQLDALCKTWKEQCLGIQLSLAQLKELLKDAGNMLECRLQTRGYQAVQIRDYINASSTLEALDLFTGSLGRMAEVLQTIRHGNFRDPMEEAKAYIDQRLSEEITLDQVAAMVGLTPTYFSALFKKLTNETFVQYRINKRIEKAKALLAIPHIRIVDVASEVGYEDYPHFTKTFKKIVGVSPSEYRLGLGIK